MMRIDEVLHALLFRRSFRQAFLRGEREALGIGAADAADLDGIDVAQLERCARLACSELLTRSHRGVGSIRDVFPRTIAAWHEMHPGRSLDDLAAEFAESEHFADYCALPSNRGITLEEAFYRFAEAAGIGDPEERLLECAHALLRALVVTSRPSFKRPDFIRECPKGYLAVVGGRVLVAALEGRLVSGPVTPFIAAVLGARGRWEPVGEKLAVPWQEAARTIAELRAMGLVGG
jgi:hypothetical protein